MLITTLKIHPLLIKFIFQTGSSTRKFSYTDCLLFSVLFKCNLIRFFYIFRLSKYFLIIRGENVTFIIEVRRGMKMLFEKYMRSRMTNDHVGSMSIIECVIYFQRN